MATLIRVDQVKDNLPMKVPSNASDPLIQQYINQAEGRVTVELNGLPDPGTDEAALMSSVVLDLATARTIIKLFGRDREMLENARELRSGAEASLTAYKATGTSDQEEASDTEDEALISSSIDESMIFDFSQPERPELSERFWE